MIVIGSINKNSIDNTLPRNKLNSFNLILDNKIIHLEKFKDIGKYGINAIATLNKNEFFYATYDSVFIYNIKKKTSEKLNIPKLGDIHEIDIYNNHLWISNTDYNELVSINLNNNNIKRINLEEIIVRKFDQKFHVNQIFQNKNNQICCLVHHVDGNQTKRILSGKILKNQGNGGIINIETSKFYNLNLKSPHTVTHHKLSKTYFIFDSGNFDLVQFDYDWKKISKLNINGFGRGACLSKNNPNILYACVSKARNRYLKFFDIEKQNENMVLTIDLNNFKIINSLTVPNVEQLSNIYESDFNYLELLNE